MLSSRPVQGEGMVSSASDPVEFVTELTLTSCLPLLMLGWMTLLGLTILIGS